MDRLMVLFNCYSINLKIRIWVATHVEDCCTPLPTTLQCFFSIRAVARPSSHTDWVCRGILDDKMSFMPKCDKISLNRNFFNVEDRCSDLFSWLKVQTSEPQIPCNSTSSHQKDSNAGMYINICMTCSWFPSAVRMWKRLITFFFFSGGDSY